MGIITNLRRWRNGEVINARDYVYERDLIVSLVNQHEQDLSELNNILTVTGSENGIFERVQFNITSEQDMEALPNGSVFYNPDKRTLAYKCEYGHIHNINQETQEIGKNVSGNSLVPGIVVTWAGAQGNHKLFVEADASDPTKSELVGVLHHPADNNEFAPVAVFAEIEIDDFREIMADGDDSYLQDGTKLYLSSTVPGKYVVTPSVRPNSNIWVSTVISINTSSHKGRIFAYPQRVVDNFNVVILTSLPVDLTPYEGFYILIKNGSNNIINNYFVENGVATVARFSATNNVVVSEEAPINQLAGDLWFDIEEDLNLVTLSGGLFTTLSFPDTLTGGTFNQTFENTLLGGSF